MFFKTFIIKNNIMYLTRQITNAIYDGGMFDCRTMISNIKYN